MESPLGQVSVNIEDARSPQAPKGYLTTSNYRSRCNTKVTNYLNFLQKKKKNMRNGQIDLSSTNNKFKNVQPVDTTLDLNTMSTNQKAEATAGRQKFKVSRKKFRETLFNQAVKSPSLNTSAYNAGLTDHQRYIMDFAQSHQLKNSRSHFSFSSGPTSCRSGTSYSSNFSSSNNAGNNLSKNQRTKNVPKQIMDETTRQDAKSGNNDTINKGDYIANRATDDITKSLNISATLKKRNIQNTNNNTSVHAVNNIQSDARLDPNTINTRKTVHNGYFEHNINNTTVTDHLNVARSHPDIKVDGIINENVNMTKIKYHSAGQSSPHTVVETGSNAIYDDKSPNYLINNGNSTMHSIATKPVNHSSFQVNQQTVMPFSNNQNAFLPGSAANQELPEKAINVPHMYVLAQNLPNDNYIGMINQLNDNTGAFNKFIVIHKKSVTTLDKPTKLKGGDMSYIPNGVNNGNNLLKKLNYTERSKFIQSNILIDDRIPANPKDTISLDNLKLLNTIRELDVESSDLSHVSKTPLDDVQLKLDDNDLSFSSGSQLSIAQENDFKTSVAKDPDNNNIYDAVTNSTRPTVLPRPPLVGVTVNTDARPTRDMSKSPLQLYRNLTEKSSFFDKTSFSLNSILNDTSEDRNIFFETPNVKPGIKPAECNSSNISQDYNDRKTVIKETQNRVKNSLEDDVNEIKYYSYRFNNKYSLTTEILHTVLRPIYEFRRTHFGEFNSGRSLQRSSIHFVSSRFKNLVSSRRSIYFKQPINDSLQLLNVNKPMASRKRSVMARSSMSSLNLPRLMNYSARVNSCRVGSRTSRSAYVATAKIIRDRRITACIRIFSTLNLILNDKFNCEFHKLFMKRFVLMKLRSNSSLLISLIVNRNSVLLGVFKLNGFIEQHRRFRLFSVLMKFWYYKTVNFEFIGAGQYEPNVYKLMDRLCQLSLH